MSKFSDRLGLTEPRFAVQINSIDDELKSCLWNVFTELLTKGIYSDDPSREMRYFVISLFHSFFKKPVDLVPLSSYSETYKIIRNYYFFEAKWYDIYNLLEFAANNYTDSEKVEVFLRRSNLVLERELSGYRFVGKQVVQMTSKQEINEVEQAIALPLTAVKLHLENAIKLISDKTSPDYRNSIKESISAVEAICKLIAKNEKTDLGGALAIIEGQGKIDLHPALRRAFLNLYGYTCDADGIRHALMDEKVKSDFDEAKFMLVACSAFVNYLISKSAKAGLKI